MINNVVLMGRLTAFPELRNTESGVPVTTFNLAVERNYKGSDGSYPADFITCVAWRNTAEFVSRYFSKGDMLALTGSIQTRSYTDRNGNKRTATEILVDNVSFCGSKTNGQTTQAKPNLDVPPPAFSTGSADDFEEVGGDDDLPF